MNKKMVTNKMSSYGRSKRVKREKWANRMAVLGVTMVVICLGSCSKRKGLNLEEVGPGLSAEGTAAGGTVA